MANIQSGATADLLTVDPTSKAARTTLYDAAGNSVIYAEDAVPSSVLGITAMGANDRNIIPIKVDRIGSLHTGFFTTLLDDQFESTIIHVNRWLATAATMTASQTSVAGLTINSGSSVAASVGYLLTSIRRFTKMIKTPLHFKCRARIVPYNNSVIELGFGDASAATGVNTSGCYWQVTTSGVVQPVITYNSVDSTGTDIRSLLDTTKYYNYEVVIQDDEALFTVQDSLTGLFVSKQSIRLPLSATKFLSGAQTAAMLRVYNSGTPPATAPQLIVSQVAVCLLNNNVNKPFPHTAAMLGRTSWENPFSGATTTVWSVSAEPTAVTLTANTAPATNNLGGKFLLPIGPAGAASDYPLFAYAVPANSTLYVTGIDIDCWNTGAAVATTATLLNWVVGVNTASTCTGGTIRVPIGAQSFAVGAAVGTAANKLSKSFDTPIVVPQGQRLILILRVPVGTATASQQISGMVNIEGYFE